MNILIIIPSTRTQCQGLGAMAYARRLSRGGNRVFVLYNIDRIELHHDGLTDLPALAMRWEGRHLALDIKREIMLFAPDIVHVWDMWSHCLTAALECVLIANARLIIHLEDDLLAVWARRHGGAWSMKPFHAIFDGIRDKAGLLAMLKQSDLDAYLKPGWISHTPNFDPLLFWGAARMADGFTAIWHPLKRRLERAFDKPVLLLPPGFDPDCAYSIRPRTRYLRREILKTMSAAPDAILCGAGGSIRHFDGEWATFLKAFQIAARRDARLYLAIWGVDTNPEITAALIARCGIAHRVFREGAVDPARFAALQQAVDIHICAGYDSDFNIYRLPSRLCPLFLAGKPLLMHRAGFGESLRDSEEAVLTYTNRAGEWAEKLLLLANNADLRARISNGARKFAARHFNMDNNTSSLSCFYTAVLAKEDVRPVDAFSWAARRLRRKLRMTGMRKVALYGAGLHSLRLIRQGWLRGIKVVAILDDAPRQETLEGIKIFNAEIKKIPTWDALVISSDTHEKMLLRKARARHWRNIWSMYGKDADGEPGKIKKRMQ